MPELAKRSPYRNEHGEELCKNCRHTKYDHRNGAGLCLGLGTDKGALGTFCSCTGFIKPPPDPYDGKREEEAYKTWKPDSSSRPHIGRSRSQFSQSSSRYALGDGKGVARPNLQGQKPGPDDGPAPEWIMFGIDAGDHVVLYASTSLSYMELRQEVGYFDELHADLIRVGTLRATPWDIKGRMVDYVVIEAFNYPEALAKLMSNPAWGFGQSDQEPSTADLQRQQALEDARDAEQQERARKAIEAPKDEIVDAEIVED